MSLRFKIKPNWDITEFYNLDYFLTTHKDYDLVDKYVSCGHDKSHMTLYNCQEPNFMPTFLHDYVKPKFHFLNNVAVAVNLFKPGKYLPVHTDPLETYTKIYDVKIEKIVRYILMLEDSSPGQIIQIEGDCFGKWKAGDCFGWRGPQPHAFYNFSMKDRYAIQVTGSED